MKVFHQEDLTSGPAILMPSEFPRKCGKGPGSYLAITPYTDPTGFLKQWPKSTIKYLFWLFLPHGGR